MNDEIISGIKLTCVGIVTIIIFISMFFILPQTLDINNKLKKLVQDQNILIKCYENPNIPNKDVCRTLIDENNK